MQSVYVEKIRGEKFTLSFSKKQGTSRGNLLVLIHVISLKLQVNFLGKFLLTLDFAKALCDTND